MTLTELQYIVAVAQERHFGRAAERAFVTQPALSLAIKKLEEELGATIFERRRNRIELTAIRPSACWRKRTKSKSSRLKARIN
jgi:LysR family transcriptional regulator, hydrogen peroxide-inducible genes activator